MIPNPDAMMKASDCTRARRANVVARSSGSRKRNLDRHWRNIRTITLHNPVAYKARVIGQNLLHGTPVPANAYF